MSEARETPAGPTRYDRRRARTRGVLLAAGRTLIATNGVAGLKIQDITEEADVALGSFYNYFDSKETFVEAVVTDSLSTLGAAIVEDDATQDPAVTASVAMRRVVRLAFDDPTFARLVVNLHNADALFARSFEPFARQVVEHGVTEGRFDLPDVNACVSLALGGSIAVMRGILDGEHADGVEMAHAEMALRMLGIPLDEAREISHRPL